MKKCLFAAVVVWISVYLTFIEALFTLDTVLKYGFVFLYFCAIGVLVSWLRKKYFPAASWISRAAAALLAAACLLCFQDFWLPRAHNAVVTVCAVGESEEGAPLGEVWLSGLTADGKETALSSLELEGNYGWTYVSEYDCYAFYPSPETKENGLSLRVRAERVTLLFEKNSWSGSAALMPWTDQEVILNLNDEASSTVEATVDVGWRYAPWQRIIMNVGAFFLLFFLLDALVSWILKRAHVQIKAA